MSSPNFTVTEHVILCQHIREYPRALKKDAPLKQVVKQYTPLNNRPPESGSITIIATHANGIPKVIWCIGVVFSPFYFCKREEEKEEERGFSLISGSTAGFSLHIS
jgi:hypothetical protein